MKSNRHVPAILGVASILGAVALAASVRSLTVVVLVGTPLLMFGWHSIKTALHASDDEIRELTSK